jgi:hypothetical protein
MNNTIRLSQIIKEDYKKQKYIQDKAIEVFDYLLSAYFKKGEDKGEFLISEFLPELNIEETDYFDLVDVEILYYIPIKNNTNEKKGKLMVSGSKDLGYYLGITLYLEDSFEEQMEQFKDKDWFWDSFRRRLLSTFIHEFNHLYYQVSSRMAQRGIYNIQSKDISTDDYMADPGEMIAHLSEFETIFLNFIKIENSNIKSKLKNNDGFELNDMRLINNVIKIKDFQTFKEFLIFLYKSGIYKKIESIEGFLYMLLNKKYKYRRNFIKKLFDIWENNKSEYLRIVDNFKEIKRKINE